MWLNNFASLNLFYIPDKLIPTIDTHIENTETGHCKKVLSIFHLIEMEISFNDSLNHIEWVVLADDDTLLR